MTERERLRRIRAWANGPTTALFDDVQDDVRWLLAALDRAAGVHLGDEGLDVERLARALGNVRGIAEWRSMEDVADSIAAAEGADSYAAQDTNDAANGLRRNVAEAIAAEYARLTEGDSR